MRVGLTLDFRNAPERRRPWKDFWEDGLYLMTEAEAMGFELLLIQEHFFQADGYGPSMPIFLTLLAERTTSARVASHLSVLPLHNPAALAQETAVLDHLSDGRLEVTVGLGHSLAEYHAFGIDPKRRPSRMEEALDVLKLAWTEHPFDYAGRFYSLQNLEVRPEPLQQPHPPLWIGATSVPAAERAGRHGAWLSSGSTDPAVHTAYREAFTAASHAAAPRASQGYAVTTTFEDPEAVWARNRELCFYRWDFYRRIRSELGDPNLTVGVGGETAADEAPAPETYRPNELIGEPALVLETLRRNHEELGFDDFILLGPASGIDWRGEGYDDVKRFAEHVLPELKTW